MNTNTTHTAPNEGQTRPVVERKIGGTTFQVSATFSPQARETAHDKIKRLILENCNNRNNNPLK